VNEAIDTNTSEETKQQNVLVQSTEAYKPNKVFVLHELFSPTHPDGHELPMCTYRPIFPWLACGKSSDWLSLSAMLLLT
jgi:hypothetical protein